jgi:hypothetical protein
MHRKAQRRFQHVFLLHPHPEGEQQPWNMPRQLARELHAAPLHEQVDEGKVEGLPANRRHRLVAAADDVDAVTLATEDDGEGTSAGEISVDQEHGGHVCRRREQCTYHARPADYKRLTPGVGRVARVSDRDSDAARLDGGRARY